MEPLWWLLAHMCFSTLAEVYVEMVNIIVSGLLLWEIYEESNDIPLWLRIFQSNYQPSSGPSASDIFLFWSYLPDSLFLAYLGYTLFFFSTGMCKKMMLVWGLWAIMGMPSKGIKDPLHPPFPAMCFYCDMLTYHRPKAKTDQELPKLWAKSSFPLYKLIISGIII